MWNETLTPEICSKARHARDARFDGRFFIAVRTTGIYCRPVCRVRPPLEKNVRYYPTAAAAEAAGFRPCLKCRPETAPGTPEWRGAQGLVARGLRLLELGPADDVSSAELAAALDLGRRQLDRLFVAQLGATPAAMQRTRRLLLAKQLITGSGLSLAEVAYAAGYGSVRRFNAHIHEVYGVSPGELRRKAGQQPPRAGVQLQLGYRPPFDWAATCDFLAARSLAGMESLAGSCYRRTLSLGNEVVTLAVQDDAGANRLLVSIDGRPGSRLLPLVGRLRRAFDLGADPATIGSHLQETPLLRRRLSRAAGIRIPAALDPFEAAVRAVLGQQVSIRSARTLLQRLVQRLALRTDEPVAGAPNMVFPSPAMLRDADLDGLGLTGRRIATLRALSSAVAAGDLPLDGSATLSEFVAEMVRLPGIGDWTAQYVALRGLAEPDAFPAGDLVLRQRASGDPARPLAEREMRAMAEAWRPWRGYACLLLWRFADDDLDSRPRKKQ